MLAQKKNGHDSAPAAFASLTAGLLARKGEAHPASAHLDGVSLHAKSAGELTPVEVQVPPAPEPHPAAAQAELAKSAVSAEAHLGRDGCCAWSLPPSVMEPLPPGQRHSVGLRVDDERLRRVKILAARAGASNQKVILAALDHYLAHMSETLATECPCLARSMTAKP